MVSVEKLNRMPHNFKDEVIGEIMSHVGRLGNVGIVFADAVDLNVAGLIKFREDVFHAVQ